MSKESLITSQAVLKHMKKELKLAKKRVKSLEAGIKYEENLIAKKKKRPLKLR